MRDVAIVSPVRTAVGSFGGSLKDVSAAELGATVIKAVLEKTGLDPYKIDDVILGHGYPSGEDPSIGSLCALKAGLPIEVPGYQLDRRCSSGLQSILNAAMMVQTGAADVVLAGGVESMSRVEYYTTDARWGGRLGLMTLHDRLIRGRATVSPEERFGFISGMIETADNVAARFAVNRACVARRVPLVSGAAVRVEGQIAVFPNDGEGPCYACLYNDEDEWLGDCQGNGVLAPVPGVIGTLMAEEALKLALGWSSSLRNRLLLWDAKRGDYAIQSRATDSQVRVQPAEAQWNPSGYLYNAIDEVKIHVA